MSVPRTPTLLLAGEGPIPGEEYLPVDVEEVLWGRLPARGDQPRLTVAPGRTLTLDTLSHEGLLPDQGSDPRAFFAAAGVDPDLVLPEAVALAEAPGRRSPQDGPHVVSPPIAVTGARPGDLIAVTILESRRRVDHGVVSSRHGRGSLPGELPAGAEVVSVVCGVRPGPDGTDLGVMPRRRDRDLAACGDDPAAGITFPLAPFPGLVGVATDTAARAHSVPPGPHGGNLDITLLQPGATLYLPVQVPGGLVYLGDPHFAQGDGEVALTAFEASLRVTVQLDVLPRADALERFGELLGPVAETSEHLIPTGLDADLDVAVARCVRAAIAILEASAGMDEASAYAYLSATTDFRISQVVDLVKGVHAQIRKADL